MSLFFLSLSHLVFYYLRKEYSYSIEVVLVQGVFLQLSIIMVLFFSLDVKVKAKYLAISSLKLFVVQYLFHGHIVMLLNLFPDNIFIDFISESILFISILLLANWITNENIGFNLREITNNLVFRFNNYRLKVLGIGCFFIISGSSFVYEPVLVRHSFIEYYSQLTYFDIVFFSLRFGMLFYLVSLSNIRSNFVKN